MISRPRLGNGIYFAGGGANVASGDSHRTRPRAASGRTMNLPARYSQMPIREKKRGPSDPDRTASPNPMTTMTTDIANGYQGNRMSAEMTLPKAVPLTVASNRVHGEKVLFGGQGTDSR